MQIDFPRFLAWYALRDARTRAEFYQDTAAALADGMDIVTYLRKRLERAKSMKDPLGPFYREWLSRMDSMRFSAAITGYVPAVESMVIGAAESGAALNDNLRFVASTAMASAAMRKAVLGAMIGPFAILSFVLGLVYAFSAFFVPLLTEIHPPHKWPQSGQMLHSVAKVMTGYGLIIVLSVGAVIGAFLWSINGFTGPRRRTADNYPPYSLLRAFNGAMTLVSVSAMMTAGSSLVDSLNAVMKTSNAWCKWHIRTILHRLDQMSGTPGKAFDTGLLPLRILNRVVDRSERSNFGEALRTMGLTVMEDVREEVNAKAKLINIILVVFAGLTMLGLLLGFLDTVYSIQSSMKAGM